MNIPAAGSVERDAIAHAGRRADREGVSMSVWQREGAYFVRASYEPQVEGGRVVFIVRPIEEPRTAAGSLD